MKGTGFGSFVGRIVLKVAERDIAAAQDKSGVTPERRAGDDETVIFELGHMLGY